MSEILLSCESQLAVQEWQKSAHGHSTLTTSITHLLSSYSLSQLIQVDTSRIQFDDQVASELELKTPWSPQPIWLSDELLWVQSETIPWNAHSSVNFIQHFHDEFTHNMLQCIHYGKYLQIFMSLILLGF